MRLIRECGWVVRTEGNEPTIHGRRLCVSICVKQQETEVLDGAWVGRRSGDELTLCRDGSVEVGPSHERVAKRPETQVRDASGRLVLAPWQQAQQKRVRRDFRDERILSVLFGVERRSQHAP